MRMRFAEGGSEGLAGAPLRDRAASASWSEVLRQALDAVVEVDKVEVFHLSVGRATYKCWAQSEQERLALLRKVWALQKQHREQQDDITRRAERTSRAERAVKSANTATGFLKRLARKKQ